MHHVFKEMKINHTSWSWVFCSEIAISVFLQKWSEYQSQLFSAQLSILHSPYRSTSASQAWTSEHRNKAEAPEGPGTNFGVDCLLPTGPASSSHFWWTSPSVGSHPQVGWVNTALRVSCHTHIPNFWLHPESRLKLQGAASSLTTLKSWRGALTAVSAEPSPGMLRSGCITSASMLCKAAATTQVPCGIGCLG